MKLLLTGFEPFGGSPINPSQMLVEALAEKTPGGIELQTALLPVDRERGPAALLAAMDSGQPDAILSFGLAIGRAKISLERVAINLMDYRIPDNAGNIVHDQPVVPGGPAAYFATLPLRALFNALQDSGIPVELSLSAGAYLCNQVFYTLLHTLATQQKPTLAGFIHLPALPEQAAQAEKPLPTLDFTTIQKAAEVMIEQLAGN